MTDLKKRCKKVAPLALDIYYYARILPNITDKDERQKIVETLWSRYEELDRALTDRQV